MAARNPLFPYFYRLLVDFTDPLLYGRIRTESMSHAEGRLLIIGIGPGNDLKYLPPEVASITAVEPDPVMRRMAERKAQRLGLSAEILDAAGERLPFPDASFDSVLCGLVLCSVDDPAATLAEVRRVLTPDGKLIVLEHVRGEGLMARFQDGIARPWSAFASGCQPNRHTAAAIAAAGFDTTDLRSHLVWPLPPPMTPHLSGVARAI
ncbi:methyltransferase domain-containing protein [Nocardia sp. ET3-3]|uniref:Methyltransferase domain-containing protein n=1 Tax=Nocardia terrae TaxID=2675851 RepID=A0A7K1VCI3_9NOCA|nr:class I SAM-dependent methyltransferase [Nocardia terrae]MVU83848.1 methyltransferase domain-containing protein [Nocardia terrae]